MVLKSSASASDADRTAKIASVAAQHFTRLGFCLFSSLHGNDKVICTGAMTRERSGGDFIEIIKYSLNIFSGLL
jgi:hypothetical protein